MSGGTVSPRILYVSSYRPCKATGGSASRSLHVFRALQQMGAVELAVLEGGGESGQVGALNGECKTAYELRIEPRPNKSLGSKLRWILDPKSPYPHGYGVVEEDAQRLFHDANDFDLVWFFKLRAPNTFPYSVWPHSVLDIDDVPSGYQWANVRAEGRLAHRIHAVIQMLSWRRRERLLGERFTGLAVCSEADRSYLARLGVHASIHVIPNGFDMPAQEMVRKVAVPPRLGFVGIFDYAPNVDGIRWFVDQCWPDIKREFPEMRLRVAGRGTDGPLKPLGPDVDGLGWVEDIDAEMATWSAMIVPILTAAGTRVKIALGFSRKCPIVSTTLGAYGYDVVDGRELFLADNAMTFARACVRAIQRREEAAEMAERAWQQFLKKWSWEVIQPRVWAAAEDCLRRSCRNGVGALKNAVF